MSATYHPILKLGNSYELQEAENALATAKQEGRDIHNELVRREIALLNAIRQALSEPEGAPYLKANPDLPAALETHFQKLNRQLRLARQADTSICEESP